MSGFGEKLRRERESRGRTIEEVARAIGLRVSYLEALEGDDFDALPGPSFGKMYIRAYAEALGFDPEPLIADYDRERYRQEREAAAGGRPERRREPSRTGPRMAARRDAVDPRPPEAGNGIEETPEGIERGEAVEASPEPSEAPIESRPEASARVSEDAGPGEGEVPTSEGETSPEAPGRVPGSRWGVIVAVLAAVVVLAMAVWAYTARVGSDGGREVPSTSADSGRTQAPLPSEEPPAPRTSSDSMPRRSEPSTAGAGDPEVRATAPTEAPQSRLTVPEFGVGRRVVNHRLEGRSDRFEEGSVVVFLTRVVGGRPGESVRHVWLHEGTPMQSVELELGGPHWRTHSRKTLRPAGRWTVEARDADDRVLARETFTCVPSN